MTKLLVCVLAVIASLPLFSQEATPVMVNLEDQQLKMGHSMEENDKWVSLTNKKGNNNLERYPVRPQYSFPGKEVIYKLPRMEGEYFFYLNDRFPDKELDVFVLTDPNDPASAIMWMNGTGAKHYINANPDMDYYLVLDAFEGVTATLNFAVAPAVSLPSVCIGSTDPITIADLRTIDPMATEVDVTRLSGTGGDFDMENGVFTPDENTTTSEFEVVTNFSDKPNVMTENITIFMVDCSAIPTLSQWYLISFLLITLILGITVLRKLDFTLINAKIF